MRSQRFDILLMISAGTTDYTAQGSQTDNWLKAFTDPQAALAKALGEQPQDVGLLAIKERHELFMKAVGVNPNPSITKATTNKWQDFTNLSDRALITEYEKVASGAKHALFGPNERGKAIIAEHKKRFPGHEGERNVEILGAALTNPSGIIPKLVVEKVTGSKLSGEVDPTDWAADRLSLIGKEGFKTKTPKAKGADSKEAKLNQSADLTLENSATTSKIEHKLPAAEGVSTSNKLKVLDDSLTPHKGLPNDSLSLQKFIDHNTGVSKTVNPKVVQHHEVLRLYDTWQQLPELVAKVPEEFGMANYNQNFKGLRWKKDGNSIRIDKGNLEAKYLTQQVDHVAISYQGNVVDHTGKNYIMYDSKANNMYKIRVEDFKKGLQGPIVLV